jgi:EAL domain-containing protein (putative c-di-GMP-specific phosphodiesterase class I)
LKIDQEFVRDLPQEASSRHVVSAVVSLAKAFSLITVAEAAEDTETLELLRQLGVDRVQGYVIARPAPVNEVLGTKSSR